MKRLKATELPEAYQARPANRADKTANDNRLETHHRAQARRFYIEHGLIALLVALAFLNAAWQMGWL